MSERSLCRATAAKPAHDPYRVFNGDVRCWPMLSIKALSCRPNGDSVV